MRRSVAILTATTILTACSGKGRALAPIQLVPIVTLGATGGDGAIATTPTVSARHPAGYRIVVPAASAIAAAPLLFLDDGRFAGTLSNDTALTQPLARPMFTRFGAGDSTWLFDNSGHVRIFNAAHQYIRSIALPDLAWDAAMLADNRILTVGDTSAIVDLRAADGALIRSFGTAGDRQGDASDGYRILRGAGALFWTTTVSNRWLLEQWDTSGTHRRTIEPHADWFPAGSELPAAGEPLGRHPPPPRIVAGWTDAAGRVWILGEVADRQWRRGLGPSGGTTGAVAVIDDDKYYDSIVEVRDPLTGKLIASVRFDQHCTSVAEPGVLVHPRLTSAGWQRAELLRVTFHGEAIGQ